MGDRSPIATSPPKPTSNVTTPVKTVADIQPSPKTAEKTEVKSSPSCALPVMPVRDVQATPSESVQGTILEAHFVRDTIADGTIVAPNSRFTQVWTLRNPGPFAWPAGCSVRFVGGDNMLNVNHSGPSLVTDMNDASESNVVGREVQAGEEVAFKVLLKAPMREGKSISYWRVKSAHGIPFGHKLWCDVDVKGTESKASTTLNGMMQPVDQQSLDHQPKTSVYWAGYQQRMAAIRFANAQRQAALQRAQQSSVEGIQQAQRVVAENTQAQTDWRKQMEDFVRRTNAANTLQPITSDDGSKADMRVKSQLPSTSGPAFSEMNDEDKAAEMRQSQMIFPTLERESPSSSAYESFGSIEMSLDKPVSAGAEVASAKVAESSPVATPQSPVDVKDEQFEDISELEVLSAEGEDSDDDGFMTDEEYDILDASDQETVASK